MESGFKIAVIGLGMIGGSMAYALRGFRSAEIIGCDINKAVCRQAVKNKAVHRATVDAGEAMEGADLIILCTQTHCGKCKTYQVGCSCDRCLWCENKAV